MSDFNDRWDFVKSHSKVLAQDKKEMEHIYNLMVGCESYLEVGTAEGNSLYVFGNALKKGSSIFYIDAAEKHTQSYREFKIASMPDYKIIGYHGNSHHLDSISKAQERRYDCVFIDAGHTYNDVLQDAKHYAPLADKYVFFHDVQLPPVMEAYKIWQLESGTKGYEIINSDNYGFGVIKI